MHAAAPGGDALRRLRNDLILAAALTVPTVLLSMFWHGRPEWANWILLALTTPVVFWAGRGFFTVAFRALRHGSATMDTLVAIGAGTAWAASLYALVAFRGGIVVFAQPGVVPAAALDELIKAVRALDMDEVRAQVAAEREDQSAEAVR